VQRLEDGPAVFFRDLPRRQELSIQTQQNSTPICSTISTSRTCLRPRHSGANVRRWVPSRNHPLIQSLTGCASKADIRALVRKCKLIASRRNSFRGVCRTSDGLRMQRRSSRTPTRITHKRVMFLSLFLTLALASATLDDQALSLDLERDRSTASGICELQDG
jgi:hypothetical protein